MAYSLINCAEGVSGKLIIKESEGYYDEPSVRNVYLLLTLPMVTFITFDFRFLDIV